MNKPISKRKLSRLAALSLINSIQLHFDSIVLFKAESYPSAFYLSVIAMEEMAKAKQLEHYYFYYTTNSEHEFEQAFLLRLYDHFAKQRAFIGRDLEFYSPRYYESVEGRQLDKRKLRALYVGLEKIRNKINTKSKISTPASVKSIDAKQQISIFNSELKYMIKNIDQYKWLFSIGEMDDVLVDSTTREIAKSWNYRSGLRSKKWWVYWSKRFEASKNKTKSPLKREL